MAGLAEAVELLVATRTYLNELSTNLKTLQRQRLAM